MKLTQQAIEDLKCELGKKDILVFDSGRESQRGLGVRVTAGARKGSLDHKSFVAQYRYGGQKRRVPLGSCSAVKLSDARKAAAAFMGHVAQGRDPAEERKAKQLEIKAKALEAKRDALTLGTLTAQWEKLHLAGKRPNYSTTAVSALRRSFAKHLDTPASKLDRAMVVRVLDGLAKDGKTAMAGATARYGSALFGWAIRRGSLTRNPFGGVPTAPAVRRDRVLSDDEIRRVWKATEGPGSFNAIVRALLLTGQRREEVSGLTWSELDPGFSVWTLPAARSKNAKPHIVPLSEGMRTLLRAQPHLNGIDLVFPGERGIFSGWSKSKSRLDRRSGVSGWTLHDLRRTLATGLQKLGVRLEVTEAVLNHVAGSRAGIIGVYQRHTWSDEKRAALNAWGEHVASIAAGREAGGNVTEFRARGA